MMAWVRCQANDALNVERRIENTDEAMSSIAQSQAAEGGIPISRINPQQCAHFRWIGVRFDTAVTHLPPVLESLLSRRRPSSLHGHNIQLRAIDGHIGK